jgi:hypothetical protein
MEIFSPISAVASLMSSSTVLEVSLMKSCLRSAFSLTILSRRPWTIFSRMFSGLDCILHLHLDLLLGGDHGGIGILGGHVLDVKGRRRPAWRCH